MCHPCVKEGMKKVPMELWKDRYTTANDYFDDSLFPRWAWAMVDNLCPPLDTFPPAHGGHVVGRCPRCPRILVVNFKSCFVLTGIGVKNSFLRNNYYGPVVL